ncbi:MAG: hypothetical protein EBQ92_03795 [Proteobacteria bacterium]|nr:hypothetical protein [Pseudomonadota bacterium]
MSENPTSESYPSGKDYFFRRHPLTDIQVKLSLKVRWRMFLFWKMAAHLQPGRALTVLDVGTTPDIERADSNCHLKWLLDIGIKPSIYSVEDVSGIAQKIPGVTAIPFSGNGNRIPIDDQSYDWVFCSATLEHVGNSEKQIAFLRELGRVASSVFLTTPNRYHWLEFHTKLPFIHWLPARWHKKILIWLGLAYWADENNLRLVSKKELHHFSSEALGKAFEIQIKQIFSLGMPSNLVLIARRK